VSHREAVELLLAATSRKQGEGFRHSFLFGKPGAPIWNRQIGIELFYVPSKLIRAVLYIRKNGPSYLKYLPVPEISKMLQNFVSENFWYIANDVLLSRSEASLDQIVAPSTKESFGKILAGCPIFKPLNQTTVFPLVPIRATTSFDSDPFFIVSPQALTPTLLLDQIDQRFLVSDQFPPLAQWTGTKHVPSAWLGVRSPVLQASVKMKSAILGSVALTQVPRCRYLFSGRKTFGGYCTISNSVTTASGEPHTPPLMHDIVISNSDHAWLTMLANKLISNERVVRRHLKALEYFYRAWSLEPSERFPVLCMTLDAIFGDANHATQSVIDGIKSVLGGHVRDARLRELMDLRASVIHGGAPDVYDSSKYGRYYDHYEADPIYDLGLIVAGCLREIIFENTMQEHIDPDHDAIAAAQARGDLPINFVRRNILEDTPENLQT
jgi:hypothetical protein